MDNRPLTELSVKELRTALATHTERGVVFNYNDVMNELERRRQQSHANKIFILSIVATVISVTSLVISVLVALKK
jgi:hypothetical protein